MIRISELKQSDIGRNVVYHREFSKKEVGILSSWNNKFVFVKFKGPNGEACEENDISFELDNKNDTTNTL